MSSNPCSVVEVISWDAFIEFILSLLPVAEKQVAAMYHMLAVDIWRGVRKSALNSVLDKTNNND